MSDGKILEALVATAEKMHVPEGFTVETNEKVYDDDGDQIAELDVVIRGTISTTNFYWLIECRDRPSAGPAPISWIEQLVTRRDRLNINKVTAVSTSGFSRPAVKLAAEKGIELREVKEADASAFDDWLALRFMTQVERRSLSSGARLIADDQGDAAKEALARALPSDATAPFLKKSSTGEVCELRHAFLGVVEKHPELFDQVQPNGPGVSITLDATYPNDDDHFVVETDVGPIRIRQIIFSGELRKIVTILPLAITAEYSGPGGKISRFAAFTPFEAQGQTFQIEMHRAEGTGETHVLARVLKTAKAEK